MSQTSKLVRAALLTLCLGVASSMGICPLAAQETEPPHRHLGESRQAQEPPSMKHHSQGHGHHQEDSATTDDGHRGHRDGHGHGGDGMHHDFSDAERWFRIFEGDDRDGWQKPNEVARIMEILPGMTVADVGAGTGYFLPYLASAVGPKGTVLGLDPEENLVAFMKERVRREGWTGVEIRQIPFDTPELPDGSTDRILIVNTWHHIDDRGSYAATLAKALAEGGRIYVVDFTRESPYGPSVKHRLPPEQVLEELRQGGLAAHLVETDLPWQYVVMAQRP